jgi:hypothetical protein
MEGGGGDGDEESDDVMVRVTSRHIFYLKI